MYKNVCIIYNMYCDGFCRYTSISNRCFFTDHPWPMAVGIAMFPRLGPTVPGVPSSRSLRGGDTLSHSPVSRSLDGGKAVFPWGNHGFMGKMMAIRKYHGKITDLFFPEVWWLEWLELKYGDTVFIFLLTRWWLECNLFYIWHSYDDIVLGFMGWWWKDMWRSIA